MTNSRNPVGIIGTGAMGAGIAQVAAASGWSVVMSDVNESAVRKAIEGIEKRLDRQLAKGLITADERGDIVKRLTIAGGPSDFARCDLVIEAVVEDLGVKAAVLGALVPVISNDAVVASNTSSLSITKIGEAIGRPQRTIGLHFFNPAPLMPLVEIVGGRRSDAEAIERATLIAEAWGKTVVRCNDTPGFIVNRVARPYYLESFRLLDEGYAAVDEVDKTMRDLAGLRMGPFELTDLIGQDVNLATSQSLWEQLGRPARLMPSKSQQKLVAEGHLGRKTGRGAYDHAMDPPTPAIAITRRALAMTDRLSDAMEAFAAKATDEVGSLLEKYILARVLAAVINEAAWAVAENVASPRDIDIALKLGTNYPKGPLEWAEEIGYAACGELLDALNETVMDKRFEAADLLKTKV